MKKSYHFLLYIVGFFIIVALFLRVTQLHHYVTLQNVQLHTNYLLISVEQNYVRSVLIYIAVVLITVICGLPTIIPLSLLAGLLFGPSKGTIYALIGIVLGSLASFLVFRYGLRAMMHRRYALTIERLKVRIDKLGISYFLVLYYSMVIPLFFINAMAALTRVSLPVFLGLTVVGSLPLVAICAAAGGQLSSIASIYDIFSPGIIAVFVVLILLACAPGIIRYCLRTWSRDQEYDEL